MRPTLMIGLVAATALGACQTPDTDAQADWDASRELEIAVRQGDEVDDICFIRDLTGWRKFDDDAVLIERSVNNWYRIELGGICHPEEAMSTIQVQTRTGSCLRRGDYLATPDTALGGSCYIARIYEWDEEAPIEQTASASEQTASLE